MKKIIIILLFFSLIYPQEKYVRGSIGWGFYAEFLWAINHLHFCATHNKTPVIYWGSSFAYYTPQGYNGSYNGWEYYFEPVSHLVYQNGDTLHTNDYYEKNFSAIWEYHQYIDNLSLLKHIDGNKILAVTQTKPRNNNHYYPISYHLYTEEFRNYIKNNIIDKYIVVKKNIMHKIDAFYQEKMRGINTIGIHLRGKFLWNNEVPEVPIDTVLAEANRYADGKTQFFIATDQKALLERAKEILNGKVIYYEAERFDQSTAPVAGQNKMHPVLGENVLVEMLLLSKCNHLIHTLSNVSTTVLYFNPMLKHTLFY